MKPWPSANTSADLSENAERRYHRRSLVETKMRCYKLLGDRVMAKDFDRQVAELQIRAAILNRFTQLETPHTLLVA